MEIVQTRDLGRWVIRAVGAVFAFAVAGLSFADRAPSFSSDWVLFYGRGLEGRLGIDFLDFNDVPFEFNTVGHFFLWGAAGCLAWLALGGRVNIVLLIASLWLASAGIEVVQPMLSSTREGSVEDLIANGLGLTLGVGGSAILTSAHRRVRRVIA